MKCIRDCSRLQPNPASGFRNLAAESVLALPTPPDNQPRFATILTVIKENQPTMKKIVLSALLVLTASSAFAADRPCRVWKVRHHHRICVRH
jgi:hypothetical protein